MTIIPWWNLYRKAVADAHELRLELTDISRQLISAQDQLRFTRDTLDVLKESEALARKEATECREKVADWIISMHGMKPLFGHPFEQQRPPQEPITGGKIHGRDAVRRMEQDFADKMFEYEQANTQ